MKPVCPDCHSKHVRLSVEVWVSKYAHQWRALRDLKKGINLYGRRARDSRDVKSDASVLDGALNELVKNRKVDLWLSSMGTNPPTDYAYTGRRPKGLVRVHLGVAPDAVPGGEKTCQTAVGEDPSVGE